MTEPVPEGQDQSADLGQAQVERLKQEGVGDLEPGLNPVEAADDPELAEDLRRAVPNPPQTVTEVTDPDSDVDLGYMEDREGEQDREELRRPVELEAVDPQEAAREAPGRPGAWPGPPPQDVS